MSYQGRRLSVGELVELARRDSSLLADAPSTPHCSYHAELCQDMLNAGDQLLDCWRFGVLQLVDRYNSAARRNDWDVARRLFEQPPSPTGSLQLDAAFAALAEYLSVRDHWATPTWAFEVERSTVNAPWWVSLVISDGFRSEVESYCPSEFSKRGVFIGFGALERA